MGEYLVIGGGHQGLTMAAYLSINGEKVKLWNRTIEHVERILKTGVIYCHGAVEGKAEYIQVEKEIQNALAKTILVTTPASAHKEIAKLIADKVSSENIVILNPGRTFGAKEFLKTLKENGCTSLPIVAETQTIVYTCRRETEDSVRIYTLKDEVPIAVENSEDIDYVMNHLPLCIRNQFKPVSSTWITSLGNVGMVLHCAPVLMNIGWIESMTSEFKYYYDGISESVAGFIEKIDRERLQIASSLGVEIESTAEWMKRTYHTEGESLFQCIQNNTYYRKIDAPNTISHRYILEDIPCGLVPLESLGICQDINTPAVTLTIDVAEMVTGISFRNIGRKLKALE